MERPPPSYPGPDSNDFTQLQRRISDLPPELCGMVYEAYLEVEEAEPQVVAIRQIAGQSVTGIQNQSAVFRSYYSNGVPRLLHLSRATRAQALQRYSLLFGGFGLPAKYFNVTLDTPLLSYVEEMTPFPQPNHFVRVRKLAICERPEVVAANLWGKIIHFSTLQKLTLERWVPPGFSGMQHWDNVFRELNDAWIFVSQVQTNRMRQIAPRAPILNVMSDVEMHQIAKIPFTSPHA